MLSHEDRTKQSWRGEMDMQDGVSVGGMSTSAIFKFFNITMGKKKGT